MTAAGATAAFSLAGCLGDDDDAISWVMNPAEEAIDIEIQYKPLFELIESEVGVEIEGVPTADYSATVQELRRGTGDLADTSPGAVVQIPEEIDVVGMRVAFGSELYFSLIATTQDSGIDELADLEGETIATAGPTSVSGTLFPMLMLHQAGLDTGGAPDGTPEDFTWRPSDHFTAREQLIQDPDIMAAGAGAFSLAPHIPQEQFDEMSPDFVDISVEYDDAGEREPNLNLLGASDPIPRAPIVARADWDHPEREEIEQVMLDAESEDFQHDPEELAEDLGMDIDILDKDEDELTEEEQEDLELYEDHQLWFNGIEAATVDDYEPVRQLMEDLGIAPEEL